MRFYIYIYITFFNTIKRVLSNVFKRCVYIYECDDLSEGLMYAKGTPSQEHRMTRCRYSLKEASSVSHTHVQNDI